METEISKTLAIMERGQVWTRASLQRDDMMLIVLIIYTLTWFLPGSSTGGSERAYFVLHYWIPSLGQWLHHARPTVIACLDNFHCTKREWCGSQWRAETTKVSPSIITSWRETPEPWTLPNPFLVISSKANSRQALAYWPHTPNQKW